MKTGKIRKPLRRLGILALILVLLLNNTMIARAENVLGTVYSYEELTEAIAGAQSGDVIILGGSIRLPKGSTLEGNYVTLRRGSKGAGLVTSYGSEATTTLRGFFFDGNEDTVGGTAPMLTIEGATELIECDFNSCVNNSSNSKGGAIRITGDVEVYLGACNFYDGNAGMGAHIYNESTKPLTIEDSYFTNGWGDIRGGSIYCSKDASSLALSNVIIKGNHSAEGGGIYTNGSLSLEDSIVYQNEASTQGADIIALGAYSNTTTEEQYNFFLNGTGLYYSEWADDTNPSVGCSGVALRFVTTDTPPTTEEPTDPPEGGDDEPTDPSDDNTDPTEPSGEGGSESGEKPSEPSSGDNTGDNPTDPQDNPSEPATEPSGGEEDDTPTDPSESSGEGSEGGSNVDSHNTTDSHDVTDSHNTEGSNNTTDSHTENSGNTDSHDVDSHDTTTTDTHTEDSHDTEGSYNTDDHSTTDNSSQDTTTIADSHDDNSGRGNTSNVSNTDNSSEDRSTHDNSSHSSTHTEDNSYRDNSSTYNYYYDPQSGGAQGVQIIEIPQYVPVESSGGSQPVSVNVPVEIKIPESYNSSPEAQEPSQRVQAPAQNIRIEAEGVNVVYEYTAEGVSISIKAPEAATEPSEPQIAQLASYSTPPAQEAQGGAREANWVEIVSMCLLAVLVLGELKDLLRRKES